MDGLKALTRRIFDLREPALVIVSFGSKTQESFSHSLLSFSYVKSAIVEGRLHIQQNVNGDHIFQLFFPSIDRRNPLTAL